jgi:hypothetical protein
MHAKDLSLMSHATGYIEQVRDGRVVKSHAEAEERGERSWAQSMHSQLRMTGIFSNIRMILLTYLVDQSRSWTGVIRLISVTRGKALQWRGLLSVLYAGTRKLVSLQRRCIFLVRTGREKKSRCGGSTYTIYIQLV